MNEQLRRAPSPDLLPRFAAIVGDRYAITDPAALEPYLIEGRGIYHGRSSMLLRPGSAAEVQAILKLANETKTPLVPQGGNTGLVGGQIPFDGELILSLTRLDKIREVDAASNTMTCEAGVVLAKAQDAAAAVDRLFPLSLGAEGSCTIGGNLSTNAGGTGAVAYGIARDLMLGDRGRPGRRPHHELAVEAEEEQHRLRPAAHLRRRRRHARRHYRCSGQAVPAPARGGDGLHRRSLSGRRGEAAQPGAGARGWDGDKLRVDRPRRHRVRAQARPRHARSARRPSIRGTC